MVYLLIICYLVVVAGFAKALLVGMHNKHGDEGIDFGSNAYCVVIAVLWPLVAVILGVLSLLKDNNTIAVFLENKKK